MTFRARTWLVTCLLMVGILSTSAVIALSARRSMQAQAEIDNQIIAEPFARAIGQGVESVRFMEALLGEQVSAIWIVDRALAVQRCQAAPDANRAPVLSEADLAALRAAVETQRAGVYADEWALRVAAPILNAPGQVTGAALLVFPAGRMRDALNQQLQLAALAVAAILGLGLLASFLASASLSRPLQNLMAAAQLMETGQLTLEQASEFAATRGQDEVSRLRQIFGRMAQEVIWRYQEVQQRGTELQSVYQIAQAITASSIDPHETLQTILERVEQMIPYDGAEICLYSPEDQGLRVQAWRGHPGFDSRGRVYRIGEGLTGWIGQERRSLLVPDIEQQSDLRPVHRQLGQVSFVRSFAGVPLLVGERLVGTLEVAGTQAGAFDAHTQQLLEIIAPQAAIAIQTAQRVQERERKLQEQIAQLRIEIDEAKKARQVAEITETDYFQELQKKVQSLRKRGEEGQA